MFKHFAVSSGGIAQEFTSYADAINKKSKSTNAHLALYHKLSPDVYQAKLDALNAEITASNKPAKRKTHVNLLLRRAQLNMELLGHFQECLPDVQEGVKENVSFAYFLRGNINSYMGKYEDAVADFAKAIQLFSAPFAEEFKQEDSFYDKLHKKLDVLLENPVIAKLHPDQQEHWEHVKQRKMIADLVATPVYQQDMYNNMAQAYLHQGFHNQALECLDKAISISGAGYANLPFFMYNKGMTLYYTKEYKQAIQLLNKSVELGVQLVHILECREQCYLAIGDADAAKRDNEERCRLLGY